MTRAPPLAPRWIAGAPGEDAEGAPLDCVYPATSEASLGGVKDSGLGRENGRAAFDHWSRVKSVHVGTAPVAARF